MRKLSSKSILIVSIDWFSKFIFPIAINLALNGRLFQGEKELPKSVVFMILGIPALLGLLSIAGGVVTYMVTQFGIESGSLIVRRKGLWRQERTIPLERIQNVAITQGLLERLLRVATVKVETAGGSGAEASLKSLSLADAEAIKAELLQIHIRPTESGPDLLSNQVYRAEWKDIALAGALQNKGLIVFAGLLGLVAEGLDDGIEKVLKFFKTSHVLDNLASNPTLSFVVVTASSILFVIFGWLLSIGYMLSIYHGFKVVRTDAGLQVSYGFFTTNQTIVPLRRVQCIQVKSSWLFRLFGLSQLFVKTIGSPEAGKEGATPGASNTLLAPIARPDVLRRLIHLINPNLDVRDLKFQGVNPFLRQSNVIWLLLWTTLPASINFAIFPAFRVHIVIAFAFTALLGIWMIFSSYKRHGYATTEDAIFVSTGIFGQDVEMIPIPNVQSMTFESGPLFRRKGLVTLRISTPVSDTLVKCFDQEAANQLFDHISRTAFTTRKFGI